MFEVIGFFVVIQLGAFVFFVVMVFKVFKHSRQIEQQTRNISYLLERVDALESKRAGEPAPREAAAAQPAAPQMVEPAASFPPPPTTPEPHPLQPSAPEPPTAPSPTEPPPSRAETPSAPPPRPAKPPQPGLLSRMFAKIRQQLKDEDFEALLGGSWLNKIGVLVLVVGVALFLGYSWGYLEAFPTLAPYLRSGAGLLIGMLLLGAGLFFERRERYGMFARGIIGGGWAVVYFTVYAMHAIEAAKIVFNPFVASALLLAVAAAMIAHAIRYRSEGAVMVSFFVAYVTLLLSPETQFALLSSVPLTGVLAVVSYRMSWSLMPVTGLALSYLAYLVQLRGGDTKGILDPDFIVAQSVLLAYWLMFEALDLLLVKKAPHTAHLTRTVSPLNTVAFLFTSLLIWNAADPHMLHWFFGGGAVLFLGSTLLRARFCPPSRLESMPGGVIRNLSGGYPFSVTVAVLLAVFGLFSNFALESVILLVSLLMLGEVVLLNGLFLREPYLRALSGGVFILTLVMLTVSLLLKIDPPLYTIHALGRIWHDWTPVALLAALVLYLNRWAARNARERWDRALLGGFSHAAWVILAIVLALEVPSGYLGAAWLALGLLLLETGLRIRMEEFRLQGYALAVLAWGALLAVNGAGLVGSLPETPWAPLALAGVLSFGLVARLHPRWSPSLPATERYFGKDPSAAAGALLLMAVLWYTLPPTLLALGWGAMALVLLETGFALALPHFRKVGNMVAGAAFVRLFFSNFVTLGVTAGISHGILTVLPVMVLLYYLSWLYRSRQKDGGLENWEQGVARIYLYLPAILAVALIRFEAGRVVAVVGWAILGLALLYLGHRLKNRDLLWQSYGIAILTFIRSWATNFYIPDYLAGVFSPPVTGGIVVACFFASQLISPRPGHRTAPQAPPGGADAGAGQQSAWEAIPPPAKAGFLQRMLSGFHFNARSIFSLFGSTLLAILLFYEISGKVLTVAWGVEALVLLMAGFALKERVLRLTGLFLFLGCILKLFLFDLAELETPFRILSFVLLGLLMIGVSWIYTRFREQIQQFI